MPLVLLKCQVTGRFLSAGFETDPDTLAALPDVLAPIPCPHCGGQHVLTKRGCLLVDPNRWAEDPKVEDCYLRATECAELAASAQAPSRKRQFLRMEQQWLRLAADYQKMAQATRLPKMTRDSSA